MNRIIYQIITTAYLPGVQCYDKENNPVMISPEEMSGPMLLYYEYTPEGRYLGPMWWPKDKRIDDFEDDECSHRLGHTYNAIWQFNDGSIMCPICGKIIKQGEGDIRVAIKESITNITYQLTFEEDAEREENLKQLLKEVQACYKHLNAKGV